MRRKSVIVLVAVCFLCVVMAAQETTGTISGTVKDPSGAVVPNATVTLTNTEKNAVLRTVTTDSSGNFSAPSLPIGHYEVTITAPGFQKYTQTDVVLNATAKLTLFPTLQVGSTQQTVTVAANAVQVDLQSPQAAGLISGTQVRQLSLNNRNYEQLVSLVPGVSSNSATDQLYVGAFAPQGTNLVTFSMNGGRREENNWLVDGADNVDRGSNLTLLSFPSVDAIAEVRVLRGQYDPEYGRSAGGQVDVVTRSGTSSLHGGVYEFFRNDVLNANSYFNKHFTTVVQRPRLRYNDFGGTIGGPVWIPKIYEHRNKTFFFVSEEARRVITYANPHAEVPLAGMLTGNFAHPVCVAFDATGACTATGTSITAINPLAAAYIQDVFSKYPSPNAATSSDPFGFTSTTRGIFNFREDMVRIDHIVSNKVALYGKILRDSIPTREPGGLFTGLPLDNVGTTETNSPGHNYTVHATVSFTPTLLMDLQYGYSYGAIVSNPVGLVQRSVSPDVTAALNLPFATTLGRIPNVTFSGGTGAQSFGPYRDFNRNHTVNGNLTKVLGNHTLKFGAVYYHYQKTENAGSGNEGTFAFTNTGVPAGTSNFEQAWANFLLGRVGTFSQTSVDMTPDIHDNQFEWYGQDTWRLRPNLTLSYGMRWSFFRQPTDAKGLLSNFDPAAYDPAKAPCILPNGNLDLTLGANGQPVSACNPNYSPLNGYIYASPPAGGTKSPFGSKVSNEDNRAIAPRIGIAWDPWGQGTTSIRAGYGMFYDNGIEFGNPEINVFNDPGFLTALTITNTSFTNPLGGTRKFSNAAPTINSRVPLKYHSPYSQQWSLDIQHQVYGWMVDVGYYGNNGIHLPGYVDINQPLPGAYLNCATGCNGVTITPPITGANTNQLNAIRPYLGYSGAYGFETIYTSNYNSLQTQVQRSFRNGSLVNFAYTWSHGLTTDQADRSTGSVIPQVSYDLRNNYGPTVADRRHIVTANFVWNMPWYRAQQGVVGHLLGGWEVSGIQTFQTGLPLTIASNQVYDPTGAGCLGPSPCVIRANQVGDPSLNAPHNYDTGWFNASAFTNPGATQTTVTTERPGAARDAGFWRTDLSLFKNIKISERVTTQFRLESFNTFNHTNPVCCSSLTTSSPSYNLVRSTRDPRIVQLGLKLDF
jgi:hypothetical protein